MILTNQDADKVSALLNEAFSPVRMFGEGLQLQRADAHPRLPGVHASELVKCLRMVGYTLRSEKKNLPPVDMLRRFGIGELGHILFQEKLKLYCANSKGAASFEDEVDVSTTPLAKELNIHSRCDGVLTFYGEDGAPMVRLGIEIKTESSTSWKTLKCAKSEHVDQGMLYMACLDLPAMAFIYINKDSGDCTPFSSEFVKPYQPHRWEALRARAEKALASHADNILLPREKGYHCMFCSYSQACGPGAAPFPTIVRPK